jgi:predicted small secreted protein
MKIIFALLAAAFVLAGCNTVRGAGQDIQKAGNAIENAAKK